MASPEEENRQLEKLHLTLEVPRWWLQTGFSGVFGHWFTARPTRVELSTSV